MENRETKTAERPRSCSGCRWSSGPHTTTAGSDRQYYLCHHEERTAKPSAIHLPWRIDGDVSEYCRHYRRRGEEYEPRRKCTACGKPMKKGYVIDGGDEYFCSEECRDTKYTRQEYIKKSLNAPDENYWTEFDD